MIVETIGDAWKQNTGEKVTTRCNPPRKKTSGNPFKQRKALFAEICGRIFQQSDGKSHEYFRTVDIRRASMGVLTIENHSECEMTAILQVSSRKKAIRRMIGPYQEAALMVGSLIRLKVIGTGPENSICKGSFTIKIHFR
jgi:molecular chaperone DnaK (HSP70)